jgi:class 3 adenylate cyclase
MLDPRSWVLGEDAHNVPCISGSAAPSGDVSSGAVGALVFIIEQGTARSTFPRSNALAIHLSRRSLGEGGTNHVFCFCPSTCSLDVRQGFAHCSCKQMAAEVKKEIALEIGHVLFVDIVGYSKLLINEQRDLLQELNQIVRSTGTFRQAEAADKLIRLPTGDGMALVFSTTSESPVECALEISRALKSRPHLHVRMGVHSGPVSGILDVNDRANVAGVGINMAQRVMDCGDAGHILLSKRVAEDLAQYQQWQSHLHDLGECKVKHGKSISMVNFYTDELGNPQVPEKFRNAQQTAAPSIWRDKPSFVGIAVFVAIFSLIALAILAVIFAPAILRSREKEMKNTLASANETSAKAIPQ